MHTYNISFRFFKIFQTMWNSTITKMSTVECLPFSRLVFKFLFLRSCPEYQVFIVLAILNYLLLFDFLPDRTSITSRGEKGKKNNISGKTPVTYQRRLPARFPREVCGRGFWEDVCTNRLLLVAPLLFFRSLSWR